MSEKRPGFITTLEAEGIKLDPEQEKAIKDIAKDVFARSVGVEKKPEELREFLYGHHHYVSESYEMRLAALRQERLVQLEQKRKALLTETARLSEQRTKFESERDAASVALTKIRSEIFTLEKRTEEDTASRRSRRRRPARPIRESEAELGPRSEPFEESDDIPVSEGAPIEEAAISAPEAPELTVAELGKKYDELFEMVPELHKKLINAPASVPSHLKEAAEAIMMRVAKGANKSFETLTKELAPKEPDRNDPNYRSWLEGQLKAVVRLSGKYENGLKEIEELVRQDAEKRKPQKISEIRIPDRTNLRRAVTSRELEIESLITRALADPFLSGNLTSVELEKKWYNRPGLAEIYQKAHKQNATLEDLAHYLEELEKYTTKLRKLFPQEFKKKK